MQANGVSGKPSIDNSATNNISAMTGGLNNVMVNGIGARKTSALVTPTSSFLPNSTATVVMSRNGPQTASHSFIDRKTSALNRAPDAEF